LQRRLTLAGFPPDHIEPGRFCSATVTTLCAFQSARGLKPSGVCDQATWAALVEAGWQLGDRMLYLTSPNLRGDDVSTLQARLCKLGFDAGRVDGIFGPHTARALMEFQRNCGLAGDGICGAETVRLLERLGRQSGDGPGVSAVREQEFVRGLRGLCNCRVVVGQFGGLSSLTRALSRIVRAHGSQVLVVDEPDALAQAQAANRFKAHVYLGFDAQLDPCSSFFYYKVAAFESRSGHALADLLASATATMLHPQPQVEGIRLPVLRETRMPAVLCSLGPVRSLIDQSHDVATAITDALARWSACEPVAVGTATAIQAR
jgi:N-acetylmuramoyl-L-alanine amidase